MHLLPGLLTASEIAALHAAAVECDAYDSAEADTVDKAPTFQANVLEDGEVVPAAAAVADLLKPIVMQRLLPYIRAKFACPDACVGDALLRRYRPAERMSLSLHYDIQAFATAIVPLSVQQPPPGATDDQRDEAAAPPGGDGTGAPSLSVTRGLSEYVGGLYVQGGASRASRRLVRFGSPGDVLVHQFDLMHGVEVSARRFSTSVSPEPLRRCAMRATATAAPQQPLHRSSRCTTTAR